MGRPPLLQDGPALEDSSKKILSAVVVPDAVVRAIQRKAGSDAPHAPRLSVRLSPNFGASSSPQESNPCGVALYL